MAGSPKVVVYHMRAPEYAEAVGAALPGVHVVPVTDEASLSTEIIDADAMIARYVPLGPLGKAGRLQWIHINSAGIEQLAGAEDALRGIQVTNTRGVQGEMMAEYVLAAMLYHQWQLGTFLRNQLTRRWDRRLTSRLSGKSVGIVGLGTVGRSIARRSAEAGLTVYGTKRVVTDIEHVKEVFPAGRLLDMLPQCDFVVLAAPLTRETRAMIGESQLARMKPGACLVNVSRGGLVDESALAAAVRSRVITGAVLDVFNEEPLPLGSPLWDCDDVLITPHVAGEGVDYIPLVAEVFRDNYWRWRRGDPLRNVVDLERGY